MEKQEFYLKSAKYDIDIHGGRISEIPVSRQGFLADGDKLHLVLKEDFNRSEFQSHVMQEIRERSYFSYALIIIRKRIGSALLLMLGLLVIAFIVLLSIYSDLTFNILWGIQLNSILKFDALTVFIFLTLILLVLLLFFPKLILGAHDNIMESAKSRFSTDEQIKRSLRYQIKLLLGKSKETKSIVVWNPYVSGENSWVPQQLLPVLIKLPVNLKIHIHLDERNELLELLEEQGVSDIVTDTSREKQIDNKEQIFPLDALAGWEKEYLSFLYYCSTRRINEIWGIDAGPQYKVSEELADVLYSRYGDRIFNFSAERIGIKKFIYRCKHDYAYLLTDNSSGKETLVLNDKIMSYVPPAGQFDALFYDLSSEMNQLLNDMDDALAILILLGLFAEKKKKLNPVVLAMLEKFIRNVNRGESYWLIHDYWEKFYCFMDNDQNDYPFELFQFMNIDVMNLLQECFLNAGMYDEVFKTTAISKSINPVKAKFLEADVNDFRGEYQAALDIFYKVNDAYFQTASFKDKKQILNLYLEISWVIVSGRIEKEKEKGFQYLEKVKGILDEIIDKEEHLKFLLQYFNYLGNYHEWNNAYDKAIASYDEALRLPSTYQRKSSMLINRGISERMKGLEKSESPEEKIQSLENSQNNIIHGMKMKIAIGEKNQLPGAYHNLAETQIELATAYPNPDRKAKLYHKALENADMGLKVIDEMNSNKKRGRLLVEKFIAEKYLEEEKKEIDSSASMQVLKNWMNSINKDSYDLYEVTSMLKRHNISASD